MIYGRLNESKRVENPEMIEAIKCIGESIADPYSVSLIPNEEKNQYYITTESVENYMLASGTTEIEEAINNIADANNIDASMIKCVGVFDEQFLPEEGSLNESVMLEKASEDNAMTVKQAEKFIKKLNKTCRSKAETIDEIDDCIKVLNKCVEDMEKAKRNDKQSSVPLSADRIKYSLKSLIPLNGFYRLFKRHDWIAGGWAIAQFVGAFAGLPGAALSISHIVARGVGWEAMINNSIKDTKEAIEYLEKKKAKLEG